VVAAALAPLKEAPSNTISGLKVGLLPEGSQYFISFSPYGYGPDSVLGSCVAIKVSSAKPLGSAPENKTIAKSNMLVVMNTDRAGEVTKGGNYTAILVFRSDGQKLVPIIYGVKTAK